MNIEEYRAMKAQEQQVQTDSTNKGEQANVQATSTTPTNQTQTNTEERQEQTNPTGEGQQAQIDSQSSTPTTPKPQTIEIDGEQVSIDELRNGYMRTKDYTHKTQEVSRKAKEQEEAIRFFESLKSNPQFAQTFAQQTQTQLPNSLDPVQSKVQELENRYYDLMLEREIEQLSSKYEDFEVKNVLEVAQQKNISNLEDAYHLYKSTTKPAEFTKQSTVDVDAIKKQVREELLRELEAERGATQSIISTSDNGTVQQTSPANLSDAEKKVARAMKMSEEEYAKWRNIK